MTDTSERLLLALTQASYIDDGELAITARSLCDAAAQSLSIDRCGLWMRAADGQSMRCIHLFDGTDGGHREFPDSVLTSAQYPRYFAAVARERSLVAHDAATHPDTSELAEGYLDVLGISSMLDCPIRQHGRTVGIICAEHRGAARHCGPPMKWRFSAACRTCLAERLPLPSVATIAIDLRH